MGAWSFMEPRLRELLDQLGRPLPIRYVGRPERASPAEGSAEHHAAKQKRIVDAAFADPPAPNGAPASRRGGRSVVAGPGNGRAAIRNGAKPRATTKAGATTRSRAESRS